MAAHLKPGDRVRVKTHTAPGHCRTPAYIKGHTGVIEAVHGAFLNPESHAHDGDGLPEQHLYLVSFDQSQLWNGYSTPNDRLFIDLYGHWLETI
tara:strand:+ start:385 stop:666 length:282 start_codon:yes stop_codon:yes gene_type:complete